MVNACPNWPPQSGRHVIPILPFTVTNHSRPHSMLCGDYSKLSGAQGPLNCDRIRQNRECCPQGWPNRAGRPISSWVPNSIHEQGPDHAAVAFSMSMARSGLRNPIPFPLNWGGRRGFFKGAQSYIANLGPEKALVLTMRPWHPSAYDGLRVDRRMLPVAQTGRVPCGQGSRRFPDHPAPQGVHKGSLVIITREYHGSGLANGSAWGLRGGLAPEKQRCPASSPAAMVGGHDRLRRDDWVWGHRRPLSGGVFSVNRQPRERVSYTTPPPWDTAGDMRYECAVDGRCRAGVSRSLLGEALTWCRWKNGMAFSFFGFPRRWTKTA
jgi:hypothetical protein